MLWVGLARSSLTDCAVTVGLTIGVLAIARPWPTDKGAERDTNGEDDAVGDFGNRDNDGKETAPSTGSLLLAASVGDTCGTIDGVAEGDIVGTDGTLTGDTDEPLATISGFDTVIDGFDTAIDGFAARGLST